MSAVCDYPIVSDDSQIQAEYVAARKRGESHNFAEMVALQRFPGLGQTDTKLFRNYGTLLDQCGGVEREAARVVSNAKKHGYSPGYNDVYMPTLAQFPGDPRAFVSQAEGFEKARRYMDELGVSPIGGPLEHKQKRVEKPPKPSVPLAERTIRRYMKQEIERDPSLKNDRKRRQAMREAIVERHKVRKD